MTLVELVLALVLLNVIILTGISMEFGTRRILSSTDLEAQLLGELSPILTRISRDISRGIGQFNVSPYGSTPVGGCSPTLRILTDSNGNGVVDVGTDITVAYGYRNSAHEMRYFPNVASPSYSVLSDRISSFSVSYNATSGQVRFAIGARINASTGVNLTNPEIIVNSSGQFRGSSFH